MDLRDRLQLLEDRTGLSQAAASKRGGFANSAFINDIFRGHKISVRAANVARLALAYGTTADFILGSSDDPALPGEPAVPVPDEQLAQVGRAAFQPVRYGGIVEAGSFRQVEDVEDDPDRSPMYEPADPEFPQAKLVYFDVAGDSMNALTPRPILPGDRVICLEFDSLQGRIPLRDDLVVIVEQTLDGGQHRERSIKQIVYYQDRVEFHPRSRNPKHKPIIVPHTIFIDGIQEDGRKVVVLAIARYTSGKLSF